MANAKQVQLFVGRLDTDLKDRLNADAAERGASVNDVAVGILADRFKVKFAATGRRGPGVRGGTTDSFRIPPALDVKIATLAARERTPKRRVVERVLAEHYTPAA